ncbi:hypothetical protein Zmor_024687 [Zophobas morio]|uniref:Uncharacterized protein n=1 Tax=Zophobas morio TaxID=2755281 RepID=A0AA38M890_9CUCU|nr:hypothetical protein Zmor_024687 [Zophobas morio]
MEEKFESFQKRAGTTDKGKDYVDVALASVVLQLINEPINNFQISSNDEVFGTFSDLIIKRKLATENEVRVTALKLNHAENRDLSTDNLKKGNFSITNYFKSFQKTNKHADEFILFTNRRFTCDDNTTFQLDEEEFSVKPVKVKALFEFSEKIDYAYQFQIVEEDWNEKTLDKIREYQKFFSKFYIYTDQENVENMKKTAAEKFIKTYSSSEEVFEKFLKRVSEWSFQEENKEKLNKKWMERVIALLLLSSNIKPLSSGPVNEKFVNERVAILREAISIFHVTLFEKKSYEKLKHVWDEMRKENKFDIGDLNKVRERYLPTVKCFDKVNFDETDPRILIQLLWLMNKCPLIIHEDENVEKAIQLCPDKKFILIGEGKKQAWMEKYSVFQNLSNLNLKPDLREKIMQKFTVSIQGKKERDLVETFGSNEELLSSVTTDNLLEMLDGPYRVCGAKETLPEPYIERCISRNVVNTTYLEKVHENTIIVLNCASNFDKVKDKLSKHKCYKHYSDDELYQIYDKHTETKSIHYFKILEDGNLEWIQSKGDVSDLKNYNLSNTYFTNENELWSLRLDKNIKLITGDAGMGKSELMKSLKNKSPPEYWTVIINPDDVNLFFHNSDFSKPADYPNLFKKFITNEKYRSLDKLERMVFEKCVKENNVIYVWDALDEIVTEHLEVVSEIIFNLSKKQVSQWVTSRCHLQTYLENKFSLLSLSINQFSEQEQQNYIRKRLTNFDISADKIDFTFEKIKSSFAVVKNVNVLGIPLQIFMLTELFRQNNEKYFKLTENTLLLTDLYEYFIQEKFISFYRDKKKVDFQNSYAEYLVNKEKGKILDSLEKLTLKIIFPEEILQGINIDFEIELAKIKDEEACLSLVVGFQNNVPRFLHGSFAEYLTARYLSRNIHNFKDTIIRNIIFGARYDNVRFFFDMLLAKNSIAHIAVLYKDYESLRTYDDEILKRKDQGARTVLHLLSSWGQRHPRLKQRVINENNTIVYELGSFDTKPESEEYFKTVTFLTDKNDIDEHDKLLNLPPLFYAVKSESLGAELKLLQIKKNQLNQLWASTDLINILFYSIVCGYEDVCQLFTVEQLTKFWTETKFPTAQYAKTLLLLACTNGNLKIFDFLVKSGVNINHVYEKDDTPLYIVSKNSNEQFGGCLATLSSKISNCWTPLHIASFHGHEKIVEYLVTNGAEINRADNLGLTPLDIASFSRHEKVVKCLMKVGAESTHLVHQNGLEIGVKYLATIGANNKGATLLHLACMKGDLNVVKDLVTDSGDVNHRANDGATPLFVASLNGHVKIVEYLAKHGAELNWANNEGWTPLSSAVQKHHDHVARCLVKAGADINLSNKYGWTPLHIASRIGHEIVVKYLTTTDTEINRVDNNGCTPLHFASRRGNENVVRYLTTGGADVNISDKNGMTPLHIAFVNGHKKVFEYLVTQGADLNRADNSGRTPLVAVSFNGDEKLVEYLVTLGANVNSADSEGWTPLHLASRNGHEKVVERLITLGAKINHAQNRGLTPLHVACQNDREKVAECLTTAGADINRGTNDGFTPLHLACQYNHLNIVKYLATHGAEINRVTNYDWTPLYLASQFGHEKVVEYLATMSADINRADKNGFTPLFVASENGHEKVVKHLTTIGAEVNRASKNGWTPVFIASQNGYEKIVEYLAAVGADVNRADIDNWTPLYIASLHGHEKVIKYLATTSNINRADKYGFTPLLVASENGKEQVVEFLVTAGAEIDRTNKNGSSPLHIASFKGHEKIVQYLVQAGALINRADKNGVTPLYLASFNGHEKTVQRLVEAGAEISRCTKDGTSPFQIAVQNGHEKVVEYLESISNHSN